MEVNIRIQSTNFPKPKSFKVFRMNLLWFFHSSPSLKMSLNCSSMCSQIILEKPTLVCFRASWICRQNYQDVLKLVVLRMLGVNQMLCLRRRLGWTDLLHLHNRRGQLQDRGQGKDQPVQNHNLILFFRGKYQLAVSLYEPLCRVGEEAGHVGNMEEGTQEGKSRWWILKSAQFGCQEEIPRRTRRKPSWSLTSAELEKTF